MEKYFLKAKTQLAQDENSRIKTVAEKYGIILPSTHTAMFQSVYSPIEEANDNKVRLAKDAVEKALPGIIMSQVNINHLGHGFIVGCILDAWVNEKAEIEIIFSFAKNVYEEEYVSALEAMATNDLSVSFELQSETSSIEYLADGTVRLHAVDFQGVGLLIGVTPAYKKAKVYEFAQLYKMRTKAHRKELMFASKIEEACDKVLADYNTLPTVAIDDIPPNMICTCPHCNMPMDNEDMLNDANMDMYHKPCVTMGKFRKPWYMRAEDLSKENVEGGVKIVEFTEEQKLKISELRAEFGDNAKDISDADLLIEEKVNEIRQTIETSKKAEEIIPASTEVVISDATTLKLEFVSEPKADYEAKIQEIDSYKKKVEEFEVKFKAQEEKITLLTTENDAFKLQEENKKAQEKADKIAGIKASLADNSYAKDFTDEDYLNEEKVNHVKMVKENEDLKAENQKLKNAKAEVNDEKVKIEAQKDETDIDTGHSEEQKELNPRKIIAKLGKRIK